MLNYIWGAMILIGVIFAAFTGNMEAVSNAALESAKEAVNLCITMAGVMALWVGLMEIASNAGIIASFTKRIQPFISFLFPRIPKNHKAREHIATNMIANICGLGWAATPAGLQAMAELSNLEEERRNRSPDHSSGVSCSTVAAKGVASKEMCTFLILNISSLQLIPVNMIAYRSQYGSVNPTAIIVPGIIATIISTMVGIVVCKIAYKIDKM